MDVNFQITTITYPSYKRFFSLDQTNDGHDKIMAKHAELINRSSSTDYEIRLNTCKIMAYKNSRDRDQMREYYHRLDNCMNEKPVLVPTESAADNKPEKKCVTKIEIVRRYFYDHVWKYIRYADVPGERKICS